MIPLLLLLAASPPQALVCVDHGKVVEVRADGSLRAPLKRQPTVPVSTVVKAGGALVAVSTNGFFTGGPAGWKKLGDLSSHGGTGLLRATSDEKGAHLFLRGEGGNSVVGEVDISPTGVLGFQRHPGKAATRVAPPSLGAIDEPQKWQALRQQLVKQIPEGISPLEAVVWAEPSPWGGSLAAVSTGEVEGDTPQARLYWVPQGAKPVELSFQGKLVGYRGLTEYVGELLLVDGRFTAAGKGTVVLRKDGTASAVPGIDGTCSAR